MKNICIIPARGGSKRIPRKNIKEFLGKPIIAYSIEAALKSGLFDEVMVSTDDEEIAAIAKQYGAKVPFLRSAETANDFATIADVLEEVLAYYNKVGQTFDAMCCILATAPLLQVEDIVAAYEVLQKKDYTTIVPVVPFSYPIMRSYKMDADGGILFNWPEYAKTRSQDIAPAYHDAGLFYWHKVEPWLNGNKTRGGYEMSEFYVQDIDTMDDWAFAEMKSKYIQKNNSEK